MPEINHEPTQERHRTPSFFSVLRDASERAVGVSDGRLRLAMGEQDTTTEDQAEAHVFLKLDEQRFGRDLKLYEFMERLGTGQGFVLILDEIVFPLKDILPESHRALAEPIEEYGLDVLPDTMHSAWKAIFAK